ncbi:glutaredoxin [Morchella conica CCBAS932]|uniref:Glutaredoxin n=1 Tax=Morchella conica CCBAS932 TaxID=1392247 RepID=A0A3N4KH64_9PEZI|nr:glutaredoxin [Morchella conica CCBAS932]
MPEVTNITSVDQFNTLIGNVPPTAVVALNFHTPWAEPCKQMNEVFKALATTAPPTTYFLSIDAEELPDISESYDVSAVPYFVLLRNASVLLRISGADPKELRSAIETQCGASSTALPPAQETTAPPATTASPTTTTTATSAETGGEEDLNTRLAKLVKAAPVMLFMKGTPAAPQCGFSRTLVGLLREKGVRYGFFNILADDEVRQGLKVFSDWPTYPQLYLEGSLVGGLDIVKEEFENDPDFLKAQSVSADA